MNTPLMDLSALPQESAEHTRQFVFRVLAERRDQFYLGVCDLRWEALERHDSRNTPSDWIAAITHYLGEAVTWPWDRYKFQASLVKVAALCAAAWEWCERTEGKMPPRHFDEHFPVDPGDLKDDGSVVIPGDVVEPVLFAVHRFLDTQVNTMPMSRSRASLLRALRDWLRKVDPPEPKPEDGHITPEEATMVVQQTPDEWSKDLREKLDRIANKNK